MLLAYIVGLVVGFLICVPIGPMNMWVVNTLLKRNFISAFSIALGAATMDFVYFMIILSGLSLFNFSPQTMHVLKIIGVIFIFVFGIKEYSTKNVTFTMSPDDQEKMPKAHSYYLMGVLIYTSNPTLIASMTGVASVIKSWNLFNTNMNNNIALSLGISCGTALWFYSLLKIVSRHKHKIPEKFFLKFSKICGLFIIVSSIILAYKVYKEIML